MHDSRVLKYIDEKPNMMVPWFLLAAYAYYVKDSPLINDSTFDKLTEQLVQNWSSVDHMHKHLLDLETLKAGTYLGAYPSIVEDTVEMLINELG